MKNMVENTTETNEQESGKKIARALSRVLADTYLVYLRTQNYHWNVTGPNFQALHTMFQNQYEALAAAADEIAERIRALGVTAPGSFEEFSKLASVKEVPQPSTAEAMIRSLIEGHESIAKTARAAFAVSEEEHDAVTVDLMVERMDEHQKTIWMLKSSI